MLKYLVITIIFFLVACSEPEEEEQFPTLSLGQLIDLREKSKSLEGFFMTTHLSDLYKSGSKTGLYLYVCIRFLNDKDLNKKLSKTGIPILIQASFVPEKPMAESVFLLYSRDQSELRDSESKRFHLEDSFIDFEGKEHRIMNVEFNPDHKITEISFIPKELKVQDLDSNSDGEDINEESEEEFRQEEEEDDMSNGDLDIDEDQIVKISSFAKLHSNSCTDWNIFSYKHDSEIPDYLQTQTESQELENEEALLKEIPDSMTEPIPEDAPDNPVE